MATSEKREPGTGLPTEKPKSSSGRKIILLLLLIATGLVFSLDFLPEGDSESEVVGPAKKHRPAAQPQNTQPANPQQPAPQQPKTSPNPVPAPPQYERAPSTLLVSSSPSDMPAQTEAALIPATLPSIPTPAQSLPNGPEAPAEPAIPAATPADTTVAAVAPPASESAAAEPAALAAAGQDASEPASAVSQSNAPEAPAELAIPAATPADATVAVVAPPAIESAAAEPAALAVAGQDASEPVIVVRKAEAAPPRIARPLPKDPVPVKITRYARRLFDRYDTNGDGGIDAAEQRQMQGAPATTDYDADGKISFDELAAYTADYSRDRRMRLTGSMVEEAVAELPPLYIPTAELDAMAAAQAAAQQAAQQAQAVPVALANQTAGPATAEPAGTVPSGKSEATEEGKAAGSEKADAPAADSPAQAQPASGQVSSKRFVTPQSRLAALPDWFRTSDANGDGQLTVAEYTPGSEKSRLAEFTRYDRNNDGVLTAQECPKKK